MAKLIIFDVYGTLIPADSENKVVRAGLRELLDFYKARLKVTCSDAPLEDFLPELKTTGIYEHFYNHYGEGNLIYNPGRLKNLGRICEDTSIPVSQAVFIGDNHSGMDERSAKHFKIQFIKVPQFRTSPPSGPEKVWQKGYVKYDPKNRFSFASLIGKL